MSSAMDNSKLAGAPFRPVHYEYKPKVNGGLFTGEPFEKNAAWGNFPCKPETGSLLQHALPSANPPPLATFHYPSANHRPGNNTPDLPGIQECNGFYMINDNRVPSTDCSTYCAIFPREPKC